ncbi:YbaY family lipoprotein [Brevundimonas lenta]|uniref:Putative lipoprotein n=1 Tax=Brevundimonas lenta TaxID=424796 RepID=A0A7W6NPH7_9CAUL|nr:YbaY family lipoprotein [Brevundimonas lenta]MBB4083430.1 putative lipoprotein [Brevundimonas lenta]
MRRAVLALTLALTACSTVPPTPPGVTPVEVTASYREFMTLYPYYRLTVRLEDVSRADAPAVVLAESSELLAGRRPPYKVWLDVPDDRVDPRYTYAVRADIHDEHGKLLFTTDTRHPVLTNGSGNTADVVMIHVR